MNKPNASIKSEIKLGGGLCICRFLTGSEQKQTGRAQCAQYKQEAEEETCGHVHVPSRWLVARRQGS